MNQAFVARAPGKMFLLGEYAVLDGGPAVVAAVERHVEVHLRADARRRLTRIAAPGHCPPFELPVDRFDPAPVELRFALAAIEAATRRFPSLAGIGLDVEIRSRLEDGAAPGQKVGLGGSAAVTTAIVAALGAAAGRDVAASRDEIFATAFAAHRTAQGGVGSGADIAASVYGGVLLFEPQPESLPRLRPLAWPARAELLVAWSGNSAATAPLVQQYLALEGGAPAPSCAAERRPRREFLHASRDSVAAFVRALDAGWLSTRSMNANGEALERLGKAAVALLTPALARIVVLARAAGAGAKLSGAGGGDCAIALTDQAEVAERVRAAWRTASIPILDLEVERGGVNVAQA